MARTAIVTGGLSGIGLSISKHLLAKGMNVAIGQRRAADTGFTDKLFSEHENNLHVATLDVRSEQSVADFVKQTRTRFDNVDILVNSAGVGIHKTVSGHSLDAWNNVIETNLTGCFLTIRECLPHMIENKWGRIINIASTAARAAMPDFPAYCASKAGLLGLSRAVALEGAPHGVSCVAVSPTWVETDMLQQSVKKQAKTNNTSYETEMENIQKANPQNRLVQTDEIASLVTFLCGETAPALTMEDIQINAGAYW